ncbi:MAG: WD40/YVTN/BNR-like repeat-containing protein [Hyphomicrobiaceae bacterium]
MSAETTLFAGVAGYVGRPEAIGKVGVFRRAAGGDWQNVLPDLETYTVNVHPKDGKVVLAGTIDGVWLSTDGGGSFKRATFPDAKKQVWCFLFDSRDPKRILAGASPIDIYRSDDTGATWRKMPNPNIPERCKGPFAHRVMRLVQHPTRPDEVYAALEIAGAARTLNFGESWDDCSPHLIELAELPHLKSKIVTDTFAEGMLDGHAITISPADPDAVVIACRMGLFESRDKGRTWVDKEMKRFSPITYGRDVKVSPQDPKTMYCALSVAAASKDGGVYRSVDAGKTWNRFDKVQVHGTIMSVGLSASDPKKVVIGARYEGEIFATADGGASWQAIPLPGPVKDIYCVAAV